MPLTTLKSVEKAIAILDCFSLEKQVLSVGEISQMTGYTKSNVSRLLATLEKRGCTEKAEGFGKYRLGYRIYLWGTIIRKQISIADIARPVMEKLRDECGEEVVLYVLEGDRRVAIEIVESIHQIAKVDLIGKSLPLYAGAAGKILLAFLPAEKRKEIFSRIHLEPLTPNTITDVDRLENDLQQIRKNGYAVSQGEREPDAFSVNAPVRNAGGRVIACLSISGPCFRLTEEKLTDYVFKVCAAAQLIAGKLGYRDI